MSHKFLYISIVTSLALGLFGCSGSTFDLASTPTLMVEPPVTVAYSPQVYVHPAQFAERPYTAVFMPFRMDQAMDNTSHYGREVARFFYQTWLSQKLFPVMEFEERVSAQQAGFGQTYAVAVARQKGADLAITGRVTRFLAGGSVGKSELAIRIEIYDAHSGQLVWSMAHSGQMEVGITKDFLLFFQKNNLPADPAYAITASIARNMAIPVRKWLNPTPSDLAKQQLANQANATDGTLLSPSPTSQDTQDYLYGSEVRQPVTDAPPPPPPSLM
ncbi:hypothetical protein [Megalodesulfovibrio paquesii]